MTYSKRRARTPAFGTPLPFLWNGGGNAGSGFRDDLQWVASVACDSYGTPAAPPPRTCGAESVTWQPAVASGRQGSHHNPKTKPPAAWLQGVFFLEPGESLPRIIGYDLLSHGAVRRSGTPRKKRVSPWESSPHPKVKCPDRISIRALSFGAWR